MKEPKIKRVNTISFKFLECDRNIKDLESLVTNKLGLTKEDFKGAGNEGRQSFHVKFSNNTKYTKLSELHGDKFEVNDSIIQVLDVSTYSTRVLIKNVPFELNNSIIRGILQQYGQVINTVTCANQDEGIFSGLMSTERIVYMRQINIPIPSTLLINLTDTYIYISYPNQERTCNRCGSLDHTAKECFVANTKNQDSSRNEEYIRPDRRPNAINLSHVEFPNLPSQAVHSGRTSSDENVCTGPANGSDVNIPHLNTQENVVPHSNNPDPNLNDADIFFDVIEPNNTENGNPIEPTNTDSPSYAQAASIPHVISDENSTRETTENLIQGNSTINVSTQHSRASYSTYDEGNVSTEASIHDTVINNNETEHDSQSQKLLSNDICRSDARNAIPPNDSKSIHSMTMRSRSHTDV